MSVFGSIIGFLKRIWNKIKKVFVRFFSFVKNLCGFFKSNINRVLSKGVNCKAISVKTTEFNEKIKEDLKTKNYNEVDIGLNLQKESIVNTFYDEDTEEIMDEFTEVVSFNSLDRETKNAFSNKDLIVLN